MKKVYAKPNIMFESFSLSQNIAAGCEVKTETMSVNQCGLEFGPMVIFVSTPVCTEDGLVENMGNGDGAANDLIYNGLCYHVFTNGEYNLFNS